MVCAWPVWLHPEAADTLAGYGVSIPRASFLQNSCSSFPATKLLLLPVSEMPWGPLSLLGVPTPSQKVPSTHTAPGPSPQGSLGSSGDPDVRMGLEAQASLLGARASRCPAPGSSARAWGLWSVAPMSTVSSEHGRGGPRKALRAGHTAAGLQATPQLSPGSPGPDKLLAVFHQ